MAEKRVLSSSDASHTRCSAAHANKSDGKCFACHHGNELAILERPVVAKVLGILRSSRPHLALPWQTTISAAICTRWRTRVPLLAFRAWQKPYPRREAASARPGIFAVAKKQACSHWDMKAALMIHFVVTDRNLGDYRRQVGRVHPNPGAGICECATKGACIVGKECAV